MTTTSPATNRGAIESERIACGVQPQSRGSSDHASMQAISPSTMRHAAVVRTRPHPGSTEGAGVAVSLVLMVIVFTSCGSEGTYRTIRSSGPPT